MAGILPRNRPTSTLPIAARFLRTRAWMEVHELARKLRDQKFEENFNMGFILTRTIVYGRFSFWCICIGVAPMHVVCFKLSAVSSKSAQRRKGEHTSPGKWQTRSFVPYPPQIWQKVDPIGKVQSDAQNVPNYESSATFLFETKYWWSVGQWKQEIEIARQDKSQKKIYRANRWKEK